MLRLAKMSILLALAWAALDPATASAERDHREGAQPLPPPNSAPTTTGYRRRPGPRIMAPLRIDIGAQGANTSAGVLSGIEARVGIHWASLSPTPTNFDVGVGVFGAILPGPKNSTVETSDDGLAYGGAYLEVGQTLAHGNYWRTWAAGRGEYIASTAFGKDHNGFGVAGRLSAELYLSGVGIAPDGLFLGTYAIGVYAEAAGRDLGDGVSPMQISAGLTFRTPLVFTP